MKCMWYNFHEFCLNSFCKSNFLQYQYRANNRNTFCEIICVCCGKVWMSMASYLKMITIGNPKF